MTTLAQDRDLDRGRAAAACVRTAGGSAMEAAGAAIAAVFGPGLDYRLLKQRVRLILRRGLVDQEVAARYARYTEQVPPYLSTTAALWLVGMERSFERHQIAVSNRVNGVNRRPRIAIMLLDELALILRWMRRCQRRIAQ